MRALTAAPLPSASWRAALLVLALLYLAGQGAFAAHAIEHLLHGESGPCEVCDLGGAPAMPSVVSALPAPGPANVGEAMGPLPSQPAGRQPRFHLPRAPPV
jgi:hypothetical protein